MLTALHLINFKSFADANLRIGPFTIVVGTNASGKSNLRDAFRFLHGIGRGYTLAEIIGGK
jgi:AAA15 family ATPase/GTPase